MAEIRNLTKNGETFYPLTHIEGILDPEGEYIGYYTENPEWIRVITDHDGKILVGIKPDGSIDWSLGIPQPIKEEILKKVDKEEGKGLINSDYASSQSAIENPEFLEVTVDSENKILGGRKIEGTRFENVGLDLGGHLFKAYNDPEDRMGVESDDCNKIVSYRDKNGAIVENVGIITKEIELSEEGLAKLNSDLDKLPVKKDWYFPKYGKVNIKQETFYLDAAGWDSYQNDVVLIQMYDDTNENASKRITLSSFYIKSTLTPTSGTYDRTSVNQESVLLELHAGKDVTSVGNKYFATSIYIPVMDGESIIDYTKEEATKIIDPDTGDVVGYEYNGRSTEVKQVSDVPPYKAWKVNKNIEHYCIADVDFGNYYNKKNSPISIKYQGNSTTAVRKRGLRLTFYKKNDYKKKDKVKIGELIRQSGYNMKSYYSDPSRLKDPVLSNIFIEIWDTRGEDAYPWNKDNVPYHGATGMIKSFPIETWFGSEFFGLQFFGYKKDEKNYMLDGDDDTSGIFVSCDHGGTSLWRSARDWADEMGVDGRELAYPDMGDDSVSVETAAALNEFFKYTKGFIDGTIEIEGQVVDFNISMLEERIDICSWIDYYICLQVFQMWDNTPHNMILYSGRDKKRFYPFFYDLDLSVSFSVNIGLEELVSIAGIRLDFWDKFKEAYWDSIINRYAYLRKTVLREENIMGICRRYAEAIPYETVKNELKRWNSGGDPYIFEVNLVPRIVGRLKWLDQNYFI